VNPPENGQLSALIRRQRLARGLTQRELALAVGLSVTAIRDLEQGITLRPRAATIGRIAGICGPVADDHIVQPPRNPDADLRIRVLGPVEARRGDTLLVLGPARHRAVLAILTLCPGKLIHRSTIADMIWPDDPPATAFTMIQNAVSCLRKVLSAVDAPPVILTSGPRYQLRREPGRLDLDSYSQLAHAAGAARRDGDLQVAWNLYEHALALWTDDPAADIEILQDSPLLVGLRARHASLTADYAEHASDHGQHDRVLSHLRLLTQRHPFDERAHACLMIALAGTGNAVAALAAYRSFRERLRHGFGLNPGELLQNAQARVLHGDYITTQRPAVTEHWPPSHSGNDGTAMSTRNLRPRDLGPPALGTPRYPPPKA
jgi:DNA-binding SARP family transcriptional activator/DNA-binding XRE family transcriptional regulator